MGRASASVAVCFLLYASTAAAYVTDTGIHTPPNYNTFTPPPAGSAYNDPVFGTGILRITNAIGTPNPNGSGNLSWIEPEYSTACPFNIDKTRILLVFQTYFGLFDGNGNFITTLPSEVSSSAEPRWSRTDPNVFYYHTGNQLKQFSGATMTASVVHTFTEYTSISGNGEMDISFDGDHFVLVGNSRYVFVYTISTDTKGPAFDTGGNAFDAVYIAANNDVTISWKQNGANRYNGIELFDQNMNFLQGTCTCRRTWMALRC